MTVQSPAPLPFITVPEMNERLFEILYDQWSVRNKIKEVEEAVSNAENKLRKAKEQRTGRWECTCIPLPPVVGWDHTSA